ncbi:MAG: glycosyltransferase, partial [Candidatus Heimdallarchaeaceae archaeon]
VICYDLPEIKPIWKNNVIWVPRGDKIKFAGEILRVLNNEKLRKIMSKKGREFVKKYDWHNIADEEMKLILFSIKHTL